MSDDPYAEDYEEVDYEEVVDYGADSYEADPYEENDPYYDDVYDDDGNAGCIADSPLPRDTFLRNLFKDPFPVSSSGGDGGGGGGASKKQREDDGNSETDNILIKTKIHSSADTLTALDVREWLSKMMRFASERTGLSASVLLSYMCCEDISKDASKETILARLGLTEDPYGGEAARASTKEEERDEEATTVGSSSAQVTILRRREEGECISCCCEDSVVYAVCGGDHFFCAACHYDHIAGMIKSEQRAITTMKCSFSGCNHVVRLDQIRRLVLLLACDDGEAREEVFKRFKIFKARAEKAQMMAKTSGETTDDLRKKMNDMPFAPELVDDPKAYTRRLLQVMLRRVVEQVVFKDEGRTLQNCSTPNCDAMYWHNTADGDYNNGDCGARFRSAKCETCKTEWCFSCYEKSNGAVVECHDPVVVCTFAMTWAKMRDNFEAYKARMRLAGILKKCPNVACATEIEKTSGAGCFHMKCSKCDTDFCWQCLATPFHAKSGNFFQCPNQRQKIDRLVKGGAGGVREEHLAHGREMRRGIEMFREKIVKEFFDRAEESLLELEKSMPKRLDEIKDELTSDCNLSYTQMRIFDNCLAVLKETVHFLKWVPVYKYFEYELDGTAGRLADVSTIDSLMSGITKDSKQLFELLYKVPTYELVSSYRRGGSEKCLETWGVYSNNLASKTTSLAKSCKKLRDEIRTQRESGNVALSKQERGHRQDRHREWRAVLLWQRELGLDEWGRPSSEDGDTSGGLGSDSTKIDEANCVPTMLDGRTVLERAQKVLQWHGAPWVAKLLYAERAFPHKPWLLAVKELRQKGALDATESMDQAAEKRRREMKVRDSVTPWWWWRCPSGRGLEPMVVEASDALEKSWKKYGVDHDELNFDRLARRFETEEKLRKRVAPDIVRTAGSNAGTTQLCTFFCRPKGCKYGSGCRYVHDRNYTPAAARASARLNVAHFKCSGVNLEHEMKLTVDFDRASIDATHGSGICMRYKAQRCDTSASVDIERKTENMPLWTCNVCANQVPHSYQKCLLCGSGRSGGVSGGDGGGRGRGERELFERFALPGTLS